MVPLLKDVDASHKKAIFTRYGGGDAVRTERYHYLEMRTKNGAGKLQGVALFDLKKDPDENQNVSGDPAYAEIRQQLKVMLDKQRKALRTEK
ncbi:MAG: DUF4976 domain-containing protein [Planctomycetia bacterium]|jgi:hypothetical protein